jgi:hypothetical protein
LQFTAVPERAEYGPGEVIKFKFLLENQGSHDILVGRRFELNKYVWLEITGPDGKELPWCGKMGESIDEFSILRPGAKLQALVRISCEAGKNSGFSFEDPGAYSVRAHYHMPEPTNSLKRIAAAAEIITGRVAAKPVTINIKKPPDS